MHWHSHTLEISFFLTKKNSLSIHMTEQSSSQYLRSCYKNRSIEKPEQRCLNNFIHNCHKWKLSWYPSIGDQIHDLEYSCNRVLFSNIKEYDLAPCKDVDKSQMKCFYMISFHFYNIFRNSKIGGVAKIVFIGASKVWEESKSCSWSRGCTVGWGNYSWL